MKQFRIAILTVGVGLVAACETTPPRPEETADETIRSKVQASMLDAAQASEARGDLNSALAYYRSAYERDPKTAAVTIGLARTLRRLDRSREAIVIAERGLVVNKREPQLMSELGKAQLADDDALEAIDTLSRAGSLMPDDWRIPSAIGVAYDRLAMHDHAERWYKKALRLAPSNAVVLNNYALSLAQVGKLEKAIASLEKATAMPETRAQIRQNLALLYATNGEFDAARRLVRLDLSDEDARANLTYYRRLARRSGDGPTSLQLPRPKAMPRRSDDEPLTILPQPSSPVGGAAPDVRPETPADEPVADDAPSETAVEVEQAAERKESATSEVVRRTRIEKDAVEKEVVSPTTTEGDDDGAALDEASSSDPTSRETVAPPPAETGITTTETGDTGSDEGDTRDASNVAAVISPNEPSVHGDDEVSSETLAVEGEEPTQQPATSDDVSKPRDTVSVPGSDDEAPDATTKVEDVVPAASDTEMAEAPSDVDDPAGDMTASADPAGVAEATVPAAADVVKASGDIRLGPGGTSPAADMDGGDGMAMEGATMSNLALTWTGVPSEQKATEPKTSDVPVFFVQLGSYRSEGAARNGISILRSAHDDILADLNLDVMAVTIPESGKYYRILTTPFPSRVSAAEICRQLRSREVNCLILRRR